MMTTATAPAIPVPCVLHWVWSLDTIPEHIKVLSIVKVMRDMRMSPIEFVTHLLVPQDAYRDNANGFYRSRGLENFLNVVCREKRGRKKFDAWYDETIGLDPLFQTIRRETDDLSVAFRRHAADVTPESLLDFDFEEHLTEVCRERSPTLRRILMTAAQTPRAAKENTLKDAEPVLVTMIQAQLAKTRS
ncbi:hypothetical protein B0H17DRAFT_1213924 [Mycena rosella]|uniref:Uncharacterized protein n=1 Tax=Mycena rosella TaxID=1033263 RepID=A0AAD7G4L5_MYCRO|nr:hypothetical protein B0H17DRAFT_1213924 [Mycena rosella]